MDWVHERFASMAPPLLPILLDAAIKGAGLLLLTALATLAMRRASAAARHLVWFLAVAALLFLPFFSVVLPAWHILPTWAQPTVATNPTAPRRGAAAGFPPAPAQSPAPHFSKPIPPSDTQLIPLYHPPTRPPALPATPPAPAPIPPQSPAPVPATPPQPTAHPHNWQESVLLIWLIGSVLYCSYILFGCLSLRRLARQSSPATDPAWTTALRQARQSLGFRGPVNLITHPHRGMPMTWGIWRAWILIPYDADDWTPDQRRAVLLHELAHAKRWDCLTQLITQLALALYWFNPLLWLAWHRIQTEREQACDDAVLATGQKASAYAEQLLHLATAPPPLPAVGYPAAIALARPGSLESRLRAILDTSRNRRAITRRALVGALLILAAIAVPLAMVRANDAKLTPVASGDSMRPSDFADRFVAALARQHLSFLDAQKLENLKARLAAFDADRLPRKLPQARREALLKAIDAYVDSRFRNPSLNDPGDPTAQDGLYLGLGDAIQTFEWQLWLAANHQPPSAEEEAQRQSQRQWIQQFIRSLPPEPGATHDSVLGEIDRLYADPLNPLFSTPMTAENFETFKKLIAADPVGHELVYASAHCMQKAWNAHYPRIESLPTPFDHGVTGGWGIGGTQVELGFVENEAWMGKSVGVSDFRKSRDVIGLVPPAYRQCPAPMDTDAKKLQWLADQGKDDLLYDAAAGGNLVGPPGTKILQLGVHCWIDADRIGDADLRHSLQLGGQPTFSLAAAVARYRSLPRLSADCFVGVLTAGGKLAVAKVDYFDPGVGLIIRPRGIDDPLWLHIRPATKPATQPQAPATQTAAQSRPSASTGAIIRRVLSVASGSGMETMQNRAYLDLDDGEYMHSRAQGPADLNYVENRRIDVAARLKGHAMDVVARHMQLAKAPGSIDSVADSTLSLESARHSLADAMRADESVLSPGMIYFFRTLQDDIGVLRVGDITASSPPMATVDYRIFSAVPWGEAGKGVQVRLRPQTSTWAVGQTPMFTLDIRNTGKSELDCLAIPDVECKYLIDGTWYGYSKPILIGARVQQLAPGEKLVGIAPIQLTSAWAQPKTPGHGWPDPGNLDVWGQPLTLAPGPHSLAVAFDNQKPFEPGSERAKALSNTVQFDIATPLASAPASQPARPAMQPALRDPWGRVGNVLRYRLLPPTGPITTQQDVTAEVEVENVGASKLAISSLGRFYADVAGWGWRHLYDPTTWTAGDPRTGRDTGKPLGFIPAGGRALVIQHFNHQLWAGKFELECGFSPSPAYATLPQTRPLPVALFVVEPGQAAAPDDGPPDYSPIWPWGPAIDHMHARLRPYDRVHDTGEIDDLTLDLRNVGNRQMAFDPSLGAMELEIDGKWYHAVSTTQPPAPLLPFGPGFRWDDWDNGYLPSRPGLDPAADWRGADGNRLKLAHGKHTIRLAIALPPMPGSGEKPVRLLTNAVERNTTGDFGSAKPLPFMDANQPANEAEAPAPTTQPSAEPPATRPAAVNPVASSGPWRARLPCGATVELVGISTNPSSAHSWWRPDGSPMAHPPAHCPTPAEVGTAVAPAYEFAIFVDDVPFAHAPGDFEIIDKIQAAPGNGDGIVSASGNWFPRPSPDLKVQPIMHVILQSFSPTEDRTKIWLGISGGEWKKVADDFTNGKADAISRMGINGTKVDVSFTVPYEAQWNPAVKDRATFINAAENLPADQQARVVAILANGKEAVAGMNPLVTDGHVHQVSASFRNVSIKDIKLFRLETRPFQWAEFKDIPLRPAPPSAPANKRR